MEAKKNWHWTDTDTEFNLLDLICIDAAHVLMWQCGREYGFAMGDLCGEHAQAMQLYLLSTEELVYLPLKNILAERYFAAFEWRAPVCPLTNREELQQILKNSGDNQDKIVRTKLLYYRDTQVRDNEHSRSLQAE